MRKLSPAKNPKSTLISGSGAWPRNCTLCAALAVLMEPILPHSAARLRTMLGLTGVRPSAPDPLAGG